MRSSGNVVEVRSAPRGPFSIVISCASASAMPSSTAPCTWFSALLGLMIWLPMSPATHTLSTFTAPSLRHRRLHDFGEVAAMAEVERDAHARALRQRASCPSPTSRATSSSTPRMRARRRSRRRRRRRRDRAASPSRSSRNCSGSLPAACASSSMNDWITNASALLPGARSGPVGTPSGIIDASSAKFGTKRAGNSVAADVARSARTARPRRTSRSDRATRRACRSRRRRP